MELLRPDKLLYRIYHIDAVLTIVDIHFVSNVHLRPPRSPIDVAYRLERTLQYRTPSVCDYVQYGY